MSHVPQETALASRLIRQSSPSGSESAVARLLAEELTALGYEAAIDAAGNVTGTLRCGTGPVVMLLGHIDTVPVGDESAWPWPPLSGTVQDGRLWGRGSVDMKAAIAVMACAGVDAAAAGFRGTIIVAGTVLEEVNGLGARHLAARQQADLVILGEPSSLEVKYGHRGRAEVTARLPGRIAHAARSVLGHNALQDASAWLVALDALELPAGGPLTGSTATPVQLHASPDAANVVPGEAVITIDYRYIPGDGPAEILARLSELEPRAELSIRTQVARSEDGSVTEEVEVVSPAWSVDPALPLVRAARDGAEAALGAAGHQLTEGVWWFATDAPWIAAAGMPVIGFGPGDPELAHTTRESVAVAELALARQVYTAMVLAVAAAWSREEA